MAYIIPSVPSTATGSPPVTSCARESESECAGSVDTSSVWCRGGELDGQGGRGGLADAALAADHVVLASLPLAIRSNPADSATVLTRRYGAPLMGAGASRGERRDATRDRRGHRRGRLAPSWCYLSKRRSRVIRRWTRRTLSRPGSSRVDDVWGRVRVPNPVLASRTFVAASNLSDFFPRRLISTGPSQQNASRITVHRQLPCSRTNHLCTCSRAQFLEANNDRAKLECAK